jgi:uncharacterized membrane protein YesL
LAAEADLRVPDAPRLGGALRSAAVDFYYNSWRLVAANVVWGLGLILVLLAPVGWLVALVFAVLLAVPTAGIYRMAALIVRGDAVYLSDAFRAYRDHFGTALGVGLATIVLLFVLGFNVVTGLTQGSPIGWALATLAGWSLVFLILFLVTAWPVLMDPRRADSTVRQRLRLAGVLVLAFPFRIGALAVLVVLITAVSTVLFAALLTISVAFVALLSTRYVLPAADRYEDRATVPVEG